MKYAHLLLASAAATALLTSAPALAQEAPATDTGQTTSSDTETQSPPAQGIADIIVTAQRRDENLQKAALAVSAVAGDSLTKASITQATDLNRLVPSVQIAPASSFTQIYLRGIGTFGSNAFAEQGVAFNLDGVYLSRPAAPAGLFYDLQRIEVLKGPQGTLYGRNATGGAINVITNKPELGQTGGYVNAEYGNYNAVKASGAVNLPIGEHVAFRLAGQYAKHDGYYSDGYDDEDTQAVRGELRAETGTGLDATLSVDYAHVGGMGGGGTIVPLLDGKTRLGPSDPRVIAAYLARDPTPPVPQIIAQDDGYQNNRFFGTALTVNADLGFAKLTVIPAYRKTDLDFRSYSGSFLIQDKENSDQMSLEARLSNQSGPINWVLGSYYFVEDVSARQFYDQASNGTRINSRLGTESYAFFGQATYSLTDRFRLTGGLRYTHDNKTQDTEAHTLPFVGFVPGVYPLVPIIQDIVSHPVSDVDFSKVTWKAGVEFDAGPRSLLYASVSTGFKSGVLYAAEGDNYSRPELLTAYTLGSKNRFLDNRLQLNVEAFYWTYKDQQITHLAPVQVATVPGVGTIYGPVFGTENAGKATIYGAEAEIVFEPTPNDMFNADIQYLHTNYDKLAYQFYSVSGGAPVVGCPTTLTSLMGASPQSKIYDVDCSGRPLVNAPEWTFNLGYQHTFSLGSAGRLMAGADTQVETSRYLSIDFLDVGKQKAYMMSNAHLTYETADGRYSLTGFVNNLENTLVFSNTLQSPAKPGTFYSQLKPPRTYGVRASVKF